EGGGGGNAADLAYADADKVTPGHEDEVHRQADEGAYQPDGQVALRVLALLGKRPGGLPPAEGEDREHHAEEQVARQAEVTGGERPEAEPAGTRRCAPGEAQPHQY